MPNMSAVMGHTECPNCEERVLIKNDGKKSVCPNCGVIRESRDRKEARYQGDDDDSAVEVIPKDTVVLGDDEEQQMSWISGPVWPDDFEDKIGSEDIEIEVGDTGDAEDES